MKITRLFLLIAILVIGVSCNKDDDVPSIDDENTFSCKINGEVFIPKEHGGFYRIDGITVTFYPNNSWLFILGDGHDEIYIYLYNVEITKSLVISESDGNREFATETANVVELKGAGNSSSNYRSIDNAGTIKIIELDINRKIVFEFENIKLVENNNSNQILNLTNGKLNINLETLNK